MVIISIISRDANILDFFTQKFINNMMGTSNLKIDGEMGKGLYS